MKEKIRLWIYVCLATIMFVNSVRSTMRVPLYPEDMVNSPRVTVIVCMVEFGLAVMFATLAVCKTLAMSRDTGGKHRTEDPVKSTLGSHS